MAFAGIVQAEEMEDKSITVNIYYTGTNGNARKHKVSGRFCRKIKEEKEGAFLMVSNKLVTN